MLLRGQIVAQQLLDAARARVQARDTAPGLGVILVGHDPASEIYVRRKLATAETVGIKTEIIRREQATTEAVVDLVKQLNARPDINGILIQLPLPANINTDTVIAALAPQKDADGFHPDNIARFLHDLRTQTPVLLLAIKSLLQATGLSLVGRRALIVGKSDVFLRPLVHQLELLGMQAAILPPNASELPAHTLAADVLIVAAGQAGLISPEMIKKDAVIIDVGFNRLPDGRVVGDVVVNKETEQKTAFITPTPGGVGPVTVAALMYNVAHL